MDTNVNNVGLAANTSGIPGGAAPTPAGFPGGGGSVLALTGQAWIRNSDGSRTELHPGAKIPPGAEIQTASGASVQIQTGGGPVTLGGERIVAYTGEMAGAEPDAGENAARPLPGANPVGTLSLITGDNDLLAGLAPTAAMVSAGGAADGEGDSNFVVLDRITLETSPLNLAYAHGGRDGAAPRISAEPEPALTQEQAQALTVAENGPTLAVSDAGTVAEGGEARFNLTLSQSHNSPLTVTFHLKQGAISPDDLDGPTVTVGGQPVELKDNGDGSYSFTVDPGVRDIVVSYHVNKDNIDESDEPFTLEATLSGGDIDGNTDTGDGTITDPLKVTVLDSTKMEGEMFEFEIVLSKKLDYAVTFQYTLTKDSTIISSSSGVPNSPEGGWAGPDFDAGLATGYVTIQAGYLSAPVEIQTTDNPYVDLLFSQEQFSLSISHPLIDDGNSGWVEAPAALDTDNSIFAAHGYLIDDEQILGVDGADNVMDAPDNGTGPEYYYNQLVVGKDGDDTLTGGNGYDILWGGSGGDTLTSKGDYDLLIGGDGNDTLTIDGGTGNQLMGGAGDDTLIANTGDGEHAGMVGGADNDRLIINAGANSITNVIGEEGEDTFVWLQTSAGTTNIQDFNRGQGDKLDLADILDGHDSDADELAKYLQASQNDDSVVLLVSKTGSFGPGAILDNVDIGIVLQNVDPGDLGASDINNVIKTLVDDGILKTHS